MPQQHALRRRVVGFLDEDDPRALATELFLQQQGEAGKMPKAARGHSKEKRSDCPLLTLGLVLDAGGFVRRSQVFAGNVREQTTLETMLSSLGAPDGALVVMDRGIATEDRVAWLRGAGYRYIVVGRERVRRFDAAAAVAHAARAPGTRCICTGHRRRTRSSGHTRLASHTNWSSGQRWEFEMGVRDTRDAGLTPTPVRVVRGQSPMSYVTGKLP